MELKKCMKVAEQVSAVFCRKNRIHDYSEVKAEAYFIMVNSMRSWLPDKGSKITSWVGFNVHRELKKKFKFDNHLVDYDVEWVPTVVNSPERLCVNKDTYAALSPVASLAMQLLMTNLKVDDVSDNRYIKSNTKRAIKTKLLSLGHKPYHIAKAFTELKQIAKSMS